MFMCHAVNYVYPPPPPPPSMYVAEGKSGWLAYNTNDVCELRLKFICHVDNCFSQRAEPF